MAKRVTQDQQIYITRAELQRRWSCSHMFVERLVATAYVPSVLSLWRRATGAAPVDPRRDRAMGALQSCESVTTETH